MIFVTGDMHGDRSRFKQINKSKIKKGDTLIVCGDFGFVWDGSKKETKFLKWIGKRKYNVVFVDGYHDNLDLTCSYPIEEWNGGQTRLISGNLRMLMRGEVFQINNKTIFAFGGGDSIDREIDSTKETDKLPTVQELNHAIDNLEKVNNTVDYIITHDAPTKVKLFIDMDNNEVNHLHAFLEKVSKAVYFKKWFFGKYHTNKVIPPCYHMIFTDVVKID
ncbi:metallophosphoesterase [Paludicola sp. MB14-C6]|uniref:metallophosphoesterase family protein n=1 Tax=Paludihabitans sp. MB14-C6 TaxID=3070656 RepID=UPI0027DD53F2|nr:metallophosphoesterase [Paludicola sp. MB14-C6]WMJ23740.1 metallophosphoesterase [Paludicola sp. MB14-C6]